MITSNILARNDFKRPYRATNVLNFILMECLPRSSVSLQKTCDKKRKQYINKWLGALNYCPLSHLKKRDVLQKGAFFLVKH